MNMHSEPTAAPEGAAAPRPAYYLDDYATWRNAAGRELSQDEVDSLTLPDPRIFPSGTALYMPRAQQPAGFRGVPSDGDIITRRHPITGALLAEAGFHDGRWHAYSYGPGRDGEPLGEFEGTAELLAALDANDRRHGVGPPDPARAAVGAVTAAYERGRQAGAAALLAVLESTNADQLADAIAEAREAGLLDDFGLSRKEPA